MLRCLLVDDSPRFVAAARGVLESEGIAVVGVARTCAEALQHVQELRPDVTLLDIDLGGESGFEVARQLHGTGRIDPCRVILISTHSGQDYAELIAASPTAGFLSKSDLSAGAVRDILTRCGNGTAPVSEPPGT